jgi:type VI secretion system protein
MKPRVEGAENDPLQLSLAASILWVNIHFGSIWRADTQTCSLMSSGCCTFKVVLVRRDCLPPRRQLALLTLAGTSLLNGCLLHPGKPKPPPTIALQVIVSPDANADSVVPFDVVAIRDKNMLKQISQMDAATWFGPKGRCSYRGGPKAKVQFYSWEFVPAQTFLLEVPKMRGAKAVLGFADYSSPGEHRVNFATSGNQLVDMGEDGVHALTNVSVPNSTLPPALERQKVCPDD